MLFPKMKPYFVAILLISFLCVFVSAEKQKIQVTSKEASIHLWPDVKSQIIGRLPSGTVLYSEYKEGKWFRVNFRPAENAVMKSGYIHQQDVEKAKPEKKGEPQIIISGKSEVVSEGGPYEGESVTLMFRDADIRDVIVFLCEVGGWSVVFDPGITGKISCELRDVPWDQALDVILKTEHLAKTLEGKVFRIGKTADLMVNR